MRKVVCIIGAIVIAVAIVVVVLINVGVIPIGLTVRQPTGNVETISIGGSTPDDDFDDENSDCTEWLPSIIGSINGIENLEYNLFQTDVTPAIVMNDYRETLINDGYNIYESIEGVTEYQGSNVYYAVYTKVLIGVAIVSVPYECCNSCIFYSTGDIFSYQYIAENNDASSVLGFL